MSAGPAEDTVIDTWLPAGTPGNAPNEEASLTRNEDIPGEDGIELTIEWQNHHPLSVFASPSDTIKDLATTLSRMTQVDTSRMTLWMNRAKRLKEPFPDTTLGELVHERTHLRFVGTPNSQIPTPSITKGRTRLAARTKAAPSRTRDWTRVQEEANYTFHDIKPLPYLPNPERSKRFLERLANDPGIKASMRKHKFSVGLLTELNPAEATTAESRLLGLNRNGGESIELRLRTDAYDGYRDYRVIRKTLCHELTHNVWGEHDANFWKLCRQIEGEVERGDWKHGGSRLTEEEFYNPDDDVDVDTADNGGWSGGEFVLGSLGDGKNSEGLSRRDILAKAAMSRISKAKDASKKAEEGRDAST